MPDTDSRLGAGRLGGTNRKKEKDLWHIRLYSLLGIVNDFKVVFEKLFFSSAPQVIHGDPELIRHDTEGFR